MARKRNRGGWLWKGVLALAVMAGIAAAWLWWDTAHWRPDEGAYPDQGVEISARDGTVNFRTLRALGAKFAYLHASDGETAQDPAFVANLRSAREAGLQVGAIHRFDPCRPADRQSANFTRMVPRDNDLLPPVIALTRGTGECAVRVNEAAVESELMTLANQIENHEAKPVILKITPEFEAEYGIAGRIERQLWLVRTRFLPDYGGRPWLIWTANEELRVEATETPLRWLVVRS
ncbi:glycoside hydrolase family 25 protein [Erythrobacteraceae bacterium WH01K]|nr:glycoside hydrolase family 25 protein [Erythrobacteraceae bacterium WH01K]